MRKLFFTIFFVMVLPAFSETVSGIVKDSVTALPLPGVNVAMAYPSFSTQTDANGYFEISVYPTSATPSFRTAPARKMEIAWDPEKGFAGEKDFSARVLDLSGKSGENFSPGVCLVIWQCGNSSGSFKFLNVPGQRQVFSLEKGEAAKALAKAAAVYELGFSKDGYNPASFQAPGGQSLNVELSPIPPVIVPPDSSKANIKISLDSPGTVTIGVVITDSVKVAP